MRFEEAFEKVEAGTATDEERAFVQAEINKLSRIRDLLDQPVPKEELVEAEEQQVIKARKRFNRKTTWRVILVSLVSLAVIAAIVCGIIFIPSLTSAHRSQKLTREQCRDIAIDFLADYTGEEPQRMIVHDVDRELRIRNGLTDATFAYEVEIVTSQGIEYTIEVSAKSGYAMLTDIDIR